MNLQNRAAPSMMTCHDCAPNLCFVAVRLGGGCGFEFLRLATQAFYHCLESLQAMGLGFSERINTAAIQAMCSKTCAGLYKHTP